MELKTILENENNEGFQFITDSDARATSGSHVNAHLWDNGESISEGLDQILKIRNINFLVIYFQNLIFIILCLQSVQ